MMWNNAGSFLAPRQETTGYAVASSGSDPPSSGDEAEDIDFTVTTPIATPCVLSIARRNPFYGSTGSAQPSFFAEGVEQEADVQPPRFVHEVNKMHVPRYYFTHHSHTHKIIVTTVLEKVREESPRLFGQEHVANFLLYSDGNAGVPK